MSSSPKMQANRVRLAILFHPAPGISYEKFSDYWLNDHANLFLSLDIVKQNLTKYEQTHFNPPANDQLAAGMGTQPSTFWGMSVFEAESNEKLQEIFQHPDYARLIFPDEKNFFDRSKSQALGGTFAVLHNQDQE